MLFFNSGIGVNNFLSEKDVIVIQFAVFFRRINDFESLSCEMKPAFALAVRQIDGAFWIYDVSFAVCFHPVFFVMIESDEVGLFNDRKKAVFIGLLFKFSGEGVRAFNVDDLTGFKNPDVYFPIFFELPMVVDNFLSVFIGKGLEVFNEGLATLFAGFELLGTILLVNNNEATVLNHLKMFGRLLNRS